MRLNGLQTRPSVQTQAIDYKEFIDLHALADGRKWIRIVLSVQWNMSALRIMLIIIKQAICLQNLVFAVQSKPGYGILNNIIRFKEWY